MKDYKHIDDLIRQKFEGFEPLPPDSVWDKVRDQIGPDAAPPKGGPVSLPIITSLAILIGLIGLLLLFSRLESTMQVQAGTNQLLTESTRLTHALTAGEQIADASSPLENREYNALENHSASALTTSTIPVRKPFDGQPSRMIGSHENTEAQAPVILRAKQGNAVRPERFSLVGKGFEGELNSSEDITITLALRNSRVSRGDQDYMSTFKPRWSVGFMFNPEVAFYAADNISNNLNYSLQVLPRVNFRHFYLQSGLGLRSGGDRGDYLINYNKYLGSYEDVYEVTFDSTENGFVPVYHTQTVDVYDTVPYYSITESRARFTYLDIPLLVGHAWNFNKVSLYLHAGPSVSILVGRSSPDPDYPDENIRILNESPQVPAREQINWQMMAGAGFMYHVSDRVSFNLEPTFRYYLTNDYEKGTLNTRHPYSFGIRAGLTYTINH